MTKAKKSSYKSADVTSVDKDAMSYILTLVRNQEAAKNVAGALNAISQNHGGRELKKEIVDAIIPPASPLHDITKAFRKYTDLPLELPVHSFLFYLSSWLLNNNVKVRVPSIQAEGGGQIVSPEIWTICLAPSGAGKTYSSDRIRKHAPISPTIEGIKSGAAFFDVLQKNEQNGDVNAMFVDEVGQMIKQIETVGSPLATLKEYLLNAYGGTQITYTTKGKGDQKVSRTNLSFYGCNVTETFFDALSKESFLDGFCQRYAFVIAESDEDRHFTEFPAYNNIKIEEQAKKAWDRITEIPLHDEYVYSTDAVIAYNTHFKELGLMIEQKGVVNVSFFRRLLQRAHKLALLYHIILGKNAQQEIDVIDVEWAMRLTESHLIDVTQAILYKSGSAKDALLKVAQIEEEMKSQNKKLVASTLTQKMRVVKDGAIDPKSLLLAHKNARPTKDKK